MSDISLVKTFEKAREIFKVGILRSLYKTHLQLAISSGLIGNRAKNIANKQLQEEIENINFYPAIETSMLIALIPLVKEVIFSRVRKRKRNEKLLLKRICVMILMMYHGYVLSEQSDDYIPGMLASLKEILGGPEGRMAYDDIIYIASDDYRHCKTIRRFFLFGTDL